jgi:NAD(P)-dependent dehydrogenase (short-subunit alcohol dehydrogenase family)
MARLSGRIAVVTGAGAGIGRASALAFAAAGARVVAADIDEASAADAARAIASAGGEARAHHVDVARSADCRRLIEETVRQFGRIDILHANAGVEICKPIWETSDADWQRVLDVNLSGAFYCCRETMKDMRRRTAPGAIVLTASPHAFVTARDISAYAASKGGMVALMRALAIEGAPLGIRVNALLPGAIATPMLEREMALAPDPAAQRARFAAAHPAARLGTPEEVAQVAVFLASDEASFVTGSCVSVDGGLMATLNSGPAISYTEG